MPQSKKLDILYPILFLVEDILALTLLLRVELVTLLS